MVLYRKTDQDLSMFLPSTEKLIEHSQPGFEKMSLTDLKSEVKPIFWINATDLDELENLLLEVTQGYPMFKVAIFDQATMKTVSNFLNFSFNPALYIFSFRHQWHLNPKHLGNSIVKSWGSSIETYLRNFNNNFLKKNFKSENESENIINNGLHKVIGSTFDNFTRNNSIVLFYRLNQKKTQQFFKHYQSLASESDNIGIVDCDTNGGRNFLDNPPPNIVLYQKNKSPQPLFGLSNYDELLYVLSVFDPIRFAAMNKTLSKCLFWPISVSSQKINKTLFT